MEKTSDQVTGENSGVTSKNAVMPQPSKAHRMYEFIKELTADGRTCYHATTTGITEIRAKHLSIVSVRGQALEIQSGERWRDYTHPALSAP